MHRIIIYILQFWCYLFHLGLEEGRVLLLDDVDIAERHYKHLLRLTDGECITTSDNNISPITISPIPVIIHGNYDPLPMFAECWQERISLLSVKELNEEVRSMFTGRLQPMAWLELFDNQMHQLVENYY